MIGSNPAFDDFITENRWAVLTTLRKDGHPVSSWVAYARDGDTLIVSTPGATFKRNSLERDPRITLCVTNDAAPFNFVSVEGTAAIETTGLIESTRMVFSNIDYDEPPDLEGWLESQTRVIIRVHPERVSGVIR